MELATLQIGGVLLVPIIVAVIEACKKAGMPTTYAPWVNAGLSVVGFLAMTFVNANPVWEQPVVMVLTMIMIFLSAAGFYDVAKRTIASSG